MFNKKISAILIFLIIVVGFLISSVLSNQKEHIRKRPVKKNSRPVKIISASNDNIPATLIITGHISALNKVELYAEVSGKLLETQTNFREGIRFSKDQPLIKIDDAVYRNNVLAQKSGLLNQITLLLPDLSIDFPKSAANWENYLDNFNLMQPLTPLPEVETSKERYYIASRNIFSLYYSVKSMEETLAKYSITAPYNGIVTESNINPGTLVRMGQKLGEFTNTDIFEMEASVGVSDAQYLKIGDKVTLTSEDMTGTFSGSIQRINKIIDRQTQTVKVYIYSSDQRLWDGMYLTATVKTRPIKSAVKIPRKLLLGQNQVYTLSDDSTLTLKNVNVVNSDENFVIVQGITDGTLILGQEIKDSYEGKKVNQYVLD